MALLWMDGFDHYGTTLSNMLDGVYAEASGAPTTTNVRTGTHSFGAGSGVVRRVLGGAKAAVGLGYAVFFSALPVGNNSRRLATFNNAANAEQVSIYCQSTGVIEVFRGVTTASLGATATPVLVAGAYQHFEARVVFSNTVGSVEVRINGVTVLTITGVDTVASGSEECSQVVFKAETSAAMWVDDYFCWDTSGSQNNDFVGDRRVRTSFPDADTAVAEMTAVGAASGYLCIDEASPNNETDYLEAPDGTLPVSEFGVQNMPTGIGAIAGVQTYVRARKTQAGTANLQASVLSGASVSAGVDRPMTEAYTYWMDVHELDPATGTPWSESAFNALKLRVKRTS